MGVLEFIRLLRSCIEAFQEAIVLGVMPGLIHPVASGWF